MSDSRKHRHAAVGKAALYWEYCQTCDADFIRCPKCGNNTCNGGEGCNLCPAVYQLADFLASKGTT
jgi:hypothetical protein